ncbi:hypothetical protein [Salinimicrobium terrae]|uniref:hypothetical protein n=1 Tax=Salinimicrobium terrae TaxID=470866 RepID=UPI0003F5CCD3|nr:hypothetical protein [Salinimicrobium terrae]
MKSYLLSFFLICFLSASAQKVTHDLISAARIEKIVFSGDEIFKISIGTGLEKKVVITTRTEGEYFNVISLDADLQNQTLFLTSRYRKVLQNGYDKLSTHKVISMEVELEIPEGMVVEIISNLASVYISGAYDAVLVELKNGSCYLKDFTGNAVINTFDGNILGTANRIDLQAASRHGTVEVPQTIKGNNKMELTSIHGDIKITETK